MKNVIDKYNVVSFDMFDTLVTRLVNKPTDVFDLVQEKYNIDNEKKIDSFKENRILAEKDAYANLQSGVEEITFDEIYSILEKKYSKKICDELKKIELEIEYNICMPNTPIINKYYNYCKLANKRIIITSDMYLPKTLIKDILNKCGIEYDRLYLSNEIGKKKRYSLFEYVIEKEKIKKTELIHIGDNLIIDYLSPIMKNMKSIKIKRKKYKNSLDKFINLLSQNNEFYYKFGYEYFGPVLLGYCKYINSNLKNEKRYFLSRDGYLMKLAYEKIYGESEDNIYMYASRRALIVPTLWACDNYADMFSKFTIKDKLTIEKAFKILGLSDEIINDYLSNQEANKEINKKFLFEDSFQEKYGNIIDIVKDNSKNEYINLCSYIESIGFNNNSSIIDIGWNGNMQLALCKLFEFEKKEPNIKGYYVGVDKNSRNIDKISMNGYLFDNKKNLDIFYSEKSINNLFESFFLAPHGSVLKYNSDNTPIFSKYEYSNEEVEIYTKIQDGALQFVTDVNKYNLTDYLCLEPNESYRNMKTFSYYPSLKMIEKFGDIQFVDNGVFYIAKPRSISYYIFHPKKFLQDLQTAGWMVGFMKRLTKISFGYKKLFIVMFKKYEKNRYNKEKRHEKK